MEAAEPDLLLSVSLLAGLDPREGRERGGREALRRPLPASGQGRLATTAVRPVSSNAPNFEA